MLEKSANSVKFQILYCREYFLNSRGNNFFEFCLNIKTTLRHYFLKTNPKKGAAILCIFLSLLTVDIHYV